MSSYMLYENALSSDVQRVTSGQRIQPTPEKETSAVNESPRKQGWSVRGRQVAVQNEVSKSGARPAEINVAPKAQHAPMSPRVSPLHSSRGSTACIRQPPAAAHPAAN